jgi:hypothetical protein
MPLRERSGGSRNQTKQVAYSCDHFHEKER